MRVYQGEMAATKLLQAVSYLLTLLLVTIMFSKQHNLTLMYINVYMWVYEYIYSTTVELHRNIIVLFTHKRALYLGVLATYRTCPLGVHDIVCYKYRI